MRESKNIELGLKNKEEGRMEAQIEEGRRTILFL